MGQQEREYELGSSELEVLRALWDLGPSTVRQVRDFLRDRGRRLAYTTVQTFLTRLEQKGFVVSNKSSLAHVFRARVTRARMTKSRLRDMARQFYDGAAGPLVLQLVRSGHLTDDELAQIQALIDRLDEPGEGKASESAGRKGGRRRSARRRGST